jgi:predicted nucleic acid-binding Zn ribbon protein
MSSDSRRRRKRSWEGGSGWADQESVESRRAPAPIDKVLDAYLASEGLGSLRVLDAITRAWSEIVGEDAAAHTVPRAVNGGELVIAVDTPARATELAFLAPRICDGVAELLGRPVIERVKGQVEGRFPLE